MEIISETTPAATQLEPQPSALVLLSDVKELIDASGGAVRTAVVQAFVDEEKTKRVTALVAGLKAYRTAKSNLAKIKADNILFGGDGKVAQECWTKAKLEERKKALEQLAKIEKAVAFALKDTPDFNLLAQIKPVAEVKDHEPKTEAKDESAS